MEPVEQRGADKVYAILRRGEVPEGWEELTDKQSYVLAQRAVVGRTLADIAQEMGVTRERIRQLEAKSIKKLASWQG